MQLLKPAQSEPAAPDRFSGPVWVDRLAELGGPSRLRYALVRFGPGARTAWHSHAVQQTLQVTDGIGIVGNRDGQLIVMRPGDIVVTPADEWHWHGALPNAFMSHLAISETAAQPGVSDVNWGAHVTDDEYLSAVAAAPNQLEDTK
jgi:quercetin dioxygenase-like cupin family protein